MNCDYVFQSRDFSSRENLLCLFSFLFLLASQLFGPPRSLAQQAASEPEDWVQYVAPGVRLVGRANTAAIHLDQNVFAMSPDGKYLVGSSGRRLVLLDWDSQQLVRKIELPTRAGNSGVTKLIWTPDGQHVLAIVEWSGRPYEAEDGTDPDDEDHLQYFAEYSPLKYGGTRLFVFDQNLKLKHDLELGAKAGDHGLVRNESFRNFTLLPDGKTLLAIGRSTAKVIDIVSGKIVAEKSGVSDGMLIGEREFVFWDSTRVWDVRENEVRSAESLGLPQQAVFQAVDSKFERLVYYDQATQETVLWNRRSGHRLVLMAGRMQAGQFSSDGKLYIFAQHFSDNDVWKHMMFHVYDTVREEFQLQAKSSDIAFRATFRPAHHSLLIRGANSPSIAEIEIGQDLVANAKQATIRLPSLGAMSYFDRDRGVVFSEGGCWIETENEAAISSCLTSLAVVSPTSSFLLRKSFDNSVHEIVKCKLNGEAEETLYSIAPSQALKTVKRLLGVKDRKRPQIQSVHLGFDPSGEIIRDVYVENENYVRFRQSSSETGKQISETTLQTTVQSTIQSRAMVSRDGRRVAFADGTRLEVMDTKTGVVTRDWKLPMAVQYMQLDSRGEYVAAALGKLTTLATTKQVVVYRVSDGAEVLSEIASGIIGFGFQPGTDRFYILTSGDENQLRFFDRDTCQETWRHSTAHAPAYGMAMSSTGEEIAIGLRDSRVEFWKLSELKSNSR